MRTFVESRLPKAPEASTSADWDAKKAKYREDVGRLVLFRGEADAWRDAKTDVVWGETIDGDGYRVRKLRYEAIPGLWIPALLYEPNPVPDKAPVILNVNGHDSKGKAADYKQIRCINQAKRGILALNVEWYGMGQLRGDGYSHPNINAIDLCGTSGIAAHYLMMKRGIDVLLSREKADPTRVGVTGLSGGGWQTIFVSGLDPRVTLTDPVAGYSAFRTRTRYSSDLGDSEQTSCDLATVVDYTHLTAMMAPNPTLLTFNAKDNCCFAAPHALPPLLEAAAPIFRLYGKEDNLRSHINEDPGDHNYGKDNREALYRHLARSWFADRADFPTTEIDVSKEVKSADELKVDLPAENLDLRGVALRLASSLPKGAEPPDDRAKLDDWRRDRRRDLRAIVRPIEGEVEARKADATAGAPKGIRVELWNLRVASTWSVAAVELTPEKVEGTALLVADAGRKGSEKAVRRLLDRNLRVVAVDPFLLGEGHVADHEYLWALMVGTVGERPLGIQAAELTSISRWLKSKHGQPVVLVADGPRSSLIGLVSAALEPEAIGGVELSGPVGSLKDLIRQGPDFTGRPEAYCFGLLERFDGASIAALVAPRAVREGDR